MRRIAHLSDLHFGTARPELLDALVDRVNAAAPDIVAISGDLTQRARSQQFREARAFLDRLAAPWRAVPGNHDVPLNNLAARLFDPWTNYRRWIAADLEPHFTDGEIALVGLNTVDPLSWQRGRLGSSALRRACAALRAEPAGCIRLVMAHHPFEHLPGEHKTPMRGAGRGIETLAACGADIVLTGHLHAWRAERFASARGLGALQVQAGTGLSTRLRGEPNDFNLLTLDPGGEVVVERFVARSGDRGFVAAEVLGFRRAAGGWALAGGG